MGDGVNDNNSNSKSNGMYYIQKYRPTPLGNPRPVMSGRMRHSNVGQSVHDLPGLEGDSALGTKANYTGTGSLSLGIE